MAKMKSNTFCASFGGKMSRGTCDYSHEGEIMPKTVSLYIFGIMLLIVAGVRTYVSFHDPNTVFVFGSGGNISVFERHHFYPAILLLIVAFGYYFFSKRKSAWKNLTTATLIGASLGLLADNFLYIVESATIGYSNYNSMLYLIAGFILVSVSFFGAGAVSNWGDKK